MSAKIDKVCAEINKTKAKIGEYQTELENIEIVELVRGVEASPAELAAFIKAFREKNGTPVSLGREDTKHEKTETDL